MRRRGFLAGLLGLPAAAVAASKLPEGVRVPQLPAAASGTPMEPIAASLWPENRIVHCASEGLTVTVNSTLSQEQLLSWRNLTCPECGKDTMEHDCGESYCESCGYAEDL